MDERQETEMIGDLLNKLEKVKGSKGRWIACCPAHVDRSPSLAITETDDGRILLKCFAGCSAQQVVEAVGMDLTDYHGDIIFYSGQKVNDKWREYTARFTEGRLTRVWYEDKQY